MKPSKFMHIVSVIVGFMGVLVFASAILSGSDNMVFGITKLDALFCATILILIAIWIQIATIHHMMLEKKGENDIPVKKLSENNEHKDGGCCH